MNWVNTSTRMMLGVPKSESVYNATSNAPAAIPGAIWGSVTRRNASQRPASSVRAASIMEASSESSDARVVRKT